MRLDVIIFCFFLEGIHQNPIGLPRVADVGMAEAFLGPNQLLCSDSKQHSTARSFRERAMECTLCVSSTQAFAAPANLSPALQALV